METTEQSFTRGPILSIRTSSACLVRATTGKLIGLEEWSDRDPLEQVGNYGESWTEFFGPKTPLNLPRGLNRLWTDGGLMYAMPIR